MMSAWRAEEQTSGYLHSAASVLLDKYGGDLYKLRKEAKQEPEAERKMLSEIKGLAKVAAMFLMSCCHVVSSFQIHAQARLTCFSHTLSPYCCIWSCTSRVVQWVFSILSSFPLLLQTALYA